MEYVFVYGTLLAEFDHEVLNQVKPSLTFISKATAKGSLYDLGEYPGYIETETGKVKGEIYSINKLEKVFNVLDEYEGLNDEQPEYIRKRTAVTLPDGTKVESWIYVYQQPLKPEHKEIMNGDYIAFIRNKVKNVS